MPSYMFILYARAIRLQLKLVHFTKPLVRGFIAKTIGESNRKLLL